MFKTERYDWAEGRGSFGPTFQTFQEAKEWCIEECKRESSYINLSNIFSVHDADKEWYNGHLFSCIWSDAEKVVKDITEHEEKQWAECRKNLGCA